MLANHCCTVILLGVVTTEIQSVASSKCSTVGIRRRLAILCGLICLSTTRGHGERHQVPNYKGIFTNRDTTFISFPKKISGIQYKSYAKSYTFVLLATRPVTRGAQGELFPPRNIFAPLEKCVGYSLKDWT